ncbi:MAG: sugar transferase [Muribaculaceae bacterium]|nr:sugar transferase [Muribaculaceae bacterium]
MYKHFFKRFFDFCISLLGLICISPILLVVTIWLHFANKGAGAFFLQERPGKDAKIFKIIKFKTMTDERDADGNLLPDAARLTKVGKFVRSTSIDELPQLFNVLKGDMALIGPRPLFVRYLPYYTKREQLRHTVRPGISGWAQVHGRNNLDWDSRLELDAWYAENLSFLIDCKVVFITIKNVLSRKDIVVIPGQKAQPLDVERNENKKTLQD